MNEECAHTNVSYAEEETDLFPGQVIGRWRCEKCQMEFEPVEGEWELRHALSALDSDAEVTKEK